MSGPLAGSSSAWGLAVRMRRSPKYLRALRTAFNETTRDKDFLGEADKLGLDVSPVGAEEAMQMLDMLAAAPPELKEQLRKLQSGG